MKFVKLASRSKTNFLLLFHLYGYNKLRLKRPCKLRSFLEYQKMNCLGKVVSYSFGQSNWYV